MDKTTEANENEARCEAFKILSEIGSLVIRKNEEDAEEIGKKIKKLQKLLPKIGLFCDNGDHGFVVIPKIFELCRFKAPLDESEVAKLIDDFAKIAKMSKFERISNYIRRNCWKKLAPNVLHPDFCESRAKDYPKKKETLKQLQAGGLNIYEFTSSPPQTNESNMIPNKEVAKILIGLEKAKNVE